MTGPTERDIESRLTDLEADQGKDVAVVFRDEQTDTLVDGDGEPTEPNPDADMVIVVSETIVETPYSDDEDMEAGDTLGW